MRLFSMIFNVVALFVTTPAQTPLINQFFNEGTQAARNAEYEKAIESYKKALFYTRDEETDDHFLAKIHSNIGICLYQLKRYEAAVPEFAEAVELSSGKYPKAFYALGMTQAELGNWNEAISAFRSAVKLRQSDGEAWFDLASALLIEKDFASAEQALRNAIKYKTVASPFGHNNLGVLLALKGDFSAAEDEFKTALNESGGELVEARKNLEFCRSYRQSFNQTLVGGFEFSTQSNVRRQI